MIRSHLALRRTTPAKRCAGFTLPASVGDSWPTHRIGATAVNYRYHRSMTMNRADAEDMTTAITDVAVDEATACLFRSLGDPARLAIVRHLAAHGEHKVVDLTAHLGLAQSTVSQHLRCLAGCGVASSRPQGR